MGSFAYFQPLLIARFETSAEQIGAVPGLSGMRLMFLYIPVGLWVDRRGRKPVINAGWSLATASTSATVLSPDWRWLLPGLTACLMSNIAMRTGLALAALAAGILCAHNALWPRYASSAGLSTTLVLALTLAGRKKRPTGCPGSPPSPLPAAGGVLLKIDAQDFP